MFVCQVADCEVALRLDPGLGKAASRAARAYIAVGLVRMANSVVRPCTVPAWWCAATATRTLVDTHHAHTLTHASTTSRGAKATLRRRRVTPSPSKRWVDVVRLSCVCAPLVMQLSKWRSLSTANDKDADAVELQALQARTASFLVRA